MLIFNQAAAKALLLVLLYGSYEFMASWCIWTKGSLYYLF